VKTGKESSLEVAGVGSKMNDLLKKIKKNHLKLIRKSRGLNNVRKNASP